jgi:hypothetical protein
MSRAATIGVVAVVAVVAFGGAFLAFSGDDGATTVAAPGTSAGNGSEAGDDNPCGRAVAEAVDGSAYEVTVSSEPDPPTPRGSTFEIVVERDGQPVSGATVCMTLDMTEMSHGANGGRAEETQPGRYEFSVDFGMRGTWEGTVFVTDAGGAPVAAPVSFDVR